MNPTLLVLAAGLGSRYGGLKQIEPIDPRGQTIIDYSVFDALRAGFDRLVFVIRRDLETAFREKIGSRFERRIAVDYVFQEIDDLPKGFAPPAGRKKPWGTGHAIHVAANAIRGPFAVINADDFYGRNAFDLLARHFQSGSADYAMVGFVLRNTLSQFGSVARGVCRASADDYLEGVVELTRIEAAPPGARYTDPSGQIHPLTGEETVSLNTWGFTPELFAQLEQELIDFLQKRGQDPSAEFFIPSVVDVLISRGAARVKVLRTPDSWFGITYRQDRPNVSASIGQLIARGDYPEALWPVDS